MAFESIATVQGTSFVGITWKAASESRIERYLRPVRTEQRTRDLQRFLAAFDNKHALAIEARLNTLTAPTLIAWGTDDVYFRREMVALASRHDPGHSASRRARGCRTFLP